MKTPKGKAPFILMANFNIIQKENYNYYPYEIVSDCTSYLVECINYLDDTGTAEIITIRNADKNGAHFLVKTNVTDKEFIFNYYSKLKDTLIMVEAFYSKKYKNKTKREMGLTTVNDKKIVRAMTDKMAFKFIEKHMNNYKI